MCDVIIFLKHNMYISFQVTSALAKKEKSAQLGCR